MDLQAPAGSMDPGLAPPLWGDRELAAATLNAFNPAAAPGVGAQLPSQDESVCLVTVSAVIAGLP